MPQGALRNLLLDSTLCIASLELLVFFQGHKMLWRKVTMVLRPFTRCNFKNSAVLFIVAVSACCQKLLVTQIVTRDYIKYQNQEILEESSSVFVS